MPNFERPIGAVDGEFRVTVVIATRNRGDHIKGLLDCLAAQDLSPVLIVIVDSSDDPDELAAVTDRCGLPIATTVVRSDIQSTTHQRNRGLDVVNSNIIVESRLSSPTHVAFIDDDVRPSKDYLRKLTMAACGDVVGASGLAINPTKPEFRRKPLGVSGLIKRLFLLESLRDGSLTSGFVAIPVAPATEPVPRGVVEVDWLIGCSVWQFKPIADLRFEENLEGYVLGEDVMFSQRARVRGKLVVLPDLILDHLEQPGGRADGLAHLVAWGDNRRRINTICNRGVLSRVGLLWCNVGLAVYVGVHLLVSKNRFSHARVDRVDSWAEYVTLTRTLFRLRSWERN